MIKANRVDLLRGALPERKRKRGGEDWKNDDLLVLLIFVGIWWNLSRELCWKNQKKLSDLRKLSAYYAPGLVRTTNIIPEICD